MNWRFFVFASFLISMLLLKFGIPIPALLAGIALAGFLNWSKQRRAVHTPSSYSRPAK